MTAWAVSLSDLARRAGRIDRVLITVVAIPVALAVVVPPQALESISFTAWHLIGIAPFLALSVGVAAYAQATGADNLIAAAFQGRVAPMIVLAALMGGLSPFCSCGVIALIAALLAIGVPLPAVMAFWLASPLMDPSMFVLTMAVMGAEFAIGKTLAAIGIGVMGGFVTYALMGFGLFANPLCKDIGNGGCGGSKIRSPKGVAWRFWVEAPRREAFAKSGLKNTLFLGKWLTLAFLLESLMLAYIPAETVTGVVGGEGPAPLLAAAAVGVPAYLNGYAALPLVGGLVEQGMTPGAAMAFLVAGGVTSIPAAIAVFALARWPVCLAYLGFALTGSLTAGFLYGLI